MALRRKWKLGIEQALLEPAVGVNAPIAQKWPMGPMPIYRCPVDVAEHDVFLID